jgi:hypothetical protein
MKRDIDTSSPEWRHECEARFVYTLRCHDRTRAHEYLEMVAKKRGQAAADKLKEDAARLWRQK